MSDEGFQEDFISQHLDPLDGHREAQDFDYDAVDRALGSKVEEMDAESVAQLAKALTVILQWLCEVQLDKDSDRAMGRRAMAMAWVVNPNLFGGMSLSELAEVLGTHKMNLSRHASDFSRLFHVRNRGQSHGWNFSATEPAKVAPVAKPRRALPTKQMGLGI